MKKAERAAGRVRCDTRLLSYSNDARKPLKYTKSLLTINTSSAHNDNGTGGHSFVKLRLVDL